MSATATTPIVPDEMRDMVALVEVLGQMVEETLAEGTVLGLSPRYVPVIVEIIDECGGVIGRAMEHCYGQIGPDDSMDDDEFARAMDVRDKPHEERKAAWRDRLRDGLRDG